MDDVFVFERLPNQPSGTFEVMRSKFRQGEDANKVAYFDIGIGNTSPKDEQGVLPGTLFDLYVQVDQIDAMYPKRLLHRNHAEPWPLAMQSRQTGKTQTAIEIIKHWQHPDTHIVNHRKVATLLPSAVWNFKRSDGMYRHELWNGYVRGLAVKVSRRFSVPERS